MESAYQYRQNQATCQRMAKASPFAADKLVFNKLAADWERLAEEAEVRESAEH